MEQKDVPAKVPGPKSTNRVVKFNRRTPAAKWNRRMLHMLSLALERDPEADLLSAMPEPYSRTLVSLRDDSKYYAALQFQNSTIQLRQFIAPGLRKHTRPPEFDPRDTRSLLQESDTAVIVRPFSDEVKKLLPEDGNLSCAIIELLDGSEVLFRYTHGFSTLVLRISETVVVKMIRETDNITEYTSMQYLHDHMPSIPAPRPHGLVKLSKFYLIFMSFMPGLSLEGAWHELEDDHKRDISCQLDAILSELRSLPFPENQPLGGVQGEGCKDMRRHIRVSSEPIMTPKDFEDFLFSKPHFGSPIFIDFLRNFSPSDQTEPSCVFTHGDFRPANIHVEQNEDGGWRVVGIIDWESSGFYPEYWESLKITNNLTTLEPSDWYRYLPKCVEPHQYPTRWLMDRVWDEHIA